MSRRETQRKRAEEAATNQRTAAYFLAGAFACLVAAGCIPVPGMDNAPYVIIPYAVAIVAAGLSASRMLGVSLWRVKPEQLEEKEESRVESVARRLFVGLVASLAAIVGELFHLLVNGLDAGFGLSGATGGAIWSLAFFAVMGVAATCFARARQLMGQRGR